MSADDPTIGTRSDADVRREMAHGLRAARESLGLTMGDVADAMRVTTFLGGVDASVVQVSAWETGREAMDARQLRAYLYAVATTKGR